MSGFARGDDQRGMACGGFSGVMAVFSVVARAEPPVYCGRIIGIKAYSAYCLEWRHE